MRDGTESLKNDLKRFITLLFSRHQCLLGTSPITVGAGPLTYPIS